MESIVSCFLRTEPHLKYQTLGLTWVVTSGAILHVSKTVSNWFNLIYKWESKHEMEREPWLMRSRDSLRSKAKMLTTGCFMWIGKLAFNIISCKALCTTRKAIFQSSRWLGVAAKKGFLNRNKYYSYHRTSRPKHCPNTLGGWHPDAHRALCSVATAIAARGISTFSSAKSILFQRHDALLVTNNALCLMSDLVFGIWGRTYFSAWALQSPYPPIWIKTLPTRWCIISNFLYLNRSSVKHKATAVIFRCRR